MAPSPGHPVLVAMVTTGSLELTQSVTTGMSGGHIWEDDDAGAGGRRVAEAC